MARILGVDIPRNKAMRIALQSLYGVGPKVALDVLKLSGIDRSLNLDTQFGRCTMPLLLN